MRGIKKNRFSLKALTLAVAAVCTAGTAQAFKIDAGPDWDMQFDNTVQWTMGWRAESMNSKIGNNPFFQTGDYKFQHKGDMVTKGQKKLLLNLADVTYIDSSGIGELVSGFTTVTNSGGQLKLLNLTKRVKDLLQITKLYTVFEVFDDEAEAIRSFS